MGCSVGTVKSTTSRALQRLRVARRPAHERKHNGESRREHHTMKTELEAEVREAFAARAGRLPMDAASRLRSIDYRPREHRLRAPAIGAGRGGGCRHRGHGPGRRAGRLDAGLRRLERVTDDAGELTVARRQTPAARAGSPTRRLGLPAPASAPGAWQNRAHRRAGTLHGRAVPERRRVRRLLHELLLHRDQPGLGGQRSGGRSATRIGAHSRQRCRRRCRSPASGLSSTVVDGTSSGDLQPVTQTHLSISSDGPYTLVDGRVAPGVTGVTLVRDDGQDVVATVDDGWLVAWWPGSATATSAQVNTASGTTNEALVPAAKTPMLPPDRRDRAPRVRAAPRRPRGPRAAGP